ncbi:MAG: DUF2247 family protein [Bacteroidetes bacterium]|nr:DUF2247 family protein [Bacteroidota bacterium]
MEIFKRGKVIDKWGIVYAGLKRNWLTTSLVIKCCEEGSIVCNAFRLDKLQIALSESLFEFYELIKKFIVEDGQPEIVWNEDALYEDFSCIPKQYWDFWEIERLLQIVVSKVDKEEKLDMVGNIHSDFNFPDSWINFCIIVL